MGLLHFRSFFFRSNAWLLIATTLLAPFCPEIVRAEDSGRASRRRQSREARDATSRSESSSRPSGEYGDSGESSVSNSSGSAAYDAVQDEEPETVISQGFLIGLISGDDGKLNGNFRVDSEGLVRLPYSVRMKASGMTLGDFQNELGRAYQRYFKGGGKVRAVIRQKRYWVDVLGRVEKPGKYLVKRDSPLDEVISLAGGLADDLNKGFVRVVQGEKTLWISLEEYYRRGDMKEVPNWGGGDRIFFQQERPDVGGPDQPISPSVRILGEVRSPGEYSYRKGADGVDYLVRSGGPVSTSDLDRVEVIRTDRKTGVHSLSTLGPLHDIKYVQESDILIVHPVRPSQTEKTLQTISLVTSILSAVALTVIAIRGTR